MKKNTLYLKNWANLKRFKQVNEFSDNYPGFFLLQETNAMIGGAANALAAEGGTFCHVIRGTCQKVPWEFQFFMMQCFCDIDSDIDIEGEEKFHYQPHSCIHYYQLNADVTLSGINWSHLAAKSWSLRRILDGYVET